MEGHCSTGQRPQWAVVPMEEEEMHLVGFYYKNIKLVHISFTGVTKQVVLMLVQAGFTGTPFVASSLIAG